MNVMSSKIQEKKTQFIELTNQMMEIVANYDEETESIIEEKLHKTRDEQVFYDLLFEVNTNSKLQLIC